MLSMPFYFFDLNSLPWPILNTWFQSLLGAQEALKEPDWPIVSLEWWLTATTSWYSASWEHLLQICNEHAGFSAHSADGNGARTWKIITCLELVGVTPLKILASLTCWHIWYIITLLPWVATGMWLSGVVLFLLHSVALLKFVFNNSYLQSHFSRDCDSFKKPD